MTPSYLTLEQQLELARRIYPGRLISDTLDGDVFMFTETDGVVVGREVFNPSLTGEDWQQVQALRVIVAAFEKNNHGADVYRHQNGTDSFYIMQTFWNECTKVRTEKCPNLLHASALALLGDKI